MFSIITITHNRKALLEKAVLSVLNQTYGQLEHIIVDDGSTDDTDTMIAGINDKRIRYFSFPHSGHLAKLRNTGLLEARGEIIAFLDSDDFFEPGYLQKLQYAYLDPETQSVICNTYILSAKQKTILFDRNNRFHEKTDLLLSKLNDEFVIYPSGFSFRQIQPAWRFNETMKYGDNDLFMRLLASGKTIVLMDPGVNITKHEFNMSHSTAEHPSFITAYSEALETLAELKKNKKISSWLYSKTVSRYLYKLGIDLSQIKRREEAKKNYLKAFFIFPFNIKALARFLFS